MKYTRYDYKRKKEDKTVVIVMLVSIVLAAVLLGTALSSIFIKDRGTKAPIENKSEEAVTDTVQQHSEKESNNLPARFIIIQSGYYGVKENAQNQKDKVKTVLNPFTIEEEGKFRVLAGIFNENDYDKILKKMNDNGLDNTKITYEINTDEESSYLIAEIMKGHLKILTTLTESYVTAVKTEEFKTWLAPLSSANEKDENYTILQEYKKYLSSLPDEIVKEKAEENYTYIYEVIKKVGIKK
ncbi:SPOR domain-containing protein [Clostridium thermarum]|uniref:SPOR domain-containing protein n=1 Tax=Clostridium thermarum TaxID=1716543 RepID=UPI00111D4912|nr:hypothetical protein [Clostridium thermarum]